MHYRNFLMLDVYIFWPLWIHSLFFPSALNPTRLTFTHSVNELALSLWLPFGVSMGGGGSSKR